MTFLKNDPTPGVTQKQMFLDRFELLVAHFGPPKIPKCVENGVFWDHKRVKNGSKPHFSKPHPRPFRVHKRGTHTLFLATFIAVLLDGSDRQRHRVKEYAILPIFPGTGPGGMCEVFLGVVDVACGDAHEIATQLECVLLSWIPDRDWWAKRAVTFVVDGASNLGVRGASARQVVDVSIIENNLFALIGKWLVLMTPLGEPCHVLHRKLGLALEAAGPTHVD